MNHRWSDWSVKEYRRALGQNVGALTSRQCMRCGMLHEADSVWKAGGAIRGNRKERFTLNGVLVSEGRGISAPPCDPSKAAAEFLAALGEGVTP
jgi:hypothetical protein